MIVIGIDPGTARIGYGVIKKDYGKISFLDAGILKISAGKNQHALLQINPVRSRARACAPGGPSGRATSNGVKKSDGHHYALLQIKNELTSLIKKWKPDLMGVERVYFSKNQKTAMSVSEARGVILLAGLEAGIEIKECSPNEVKSGLTGYGLADKRGVAKMVNLALGTPNLKVIDDASDALAIAIFASGSLKTGR